MFKDEVRIASRGSASGASRSGNVMPVFRHSKGKQSGFSFVEVLIAVAILGGAALMLVGSLYSGTVVIGKMQQQNTAENLARSQLEFMKSEVYQDAPVTYSSISGIPAGYSITAIASSVAGKDSQIQKITVTVYREATVAYTLEGYKVNR